MSSVKTTLCVASVMILVSLVQSEVCLVKNTTGGVVTWDTTYTCPFSNKTPDSVFCCYNSEDLLNCCNGFEFISYKVHKHLPGVLTLLIIVIVLMLICCIVCICIPCYCLMRRRPSNKEPSDNANMIAANSLPNETEEVNTPKKEVTHHLPPGAYPVYPQFMGMQPLKSTEVNC